MNFQWPNTDYGASWVRGAQNNRAQAEFEAQQQQAQEAMALRQQEFQALQDYRNRQLTAAEQLRQLRQNALNRLLQETQGVAPSQQPPSPAVPNPADALRQPDTQGDPEAQARPDSELSAADALRKTTVQSDPDETAMEAAGETAKPTRTTAPQSGLSAADELRRRERLIALGNLAGLPASSIAALAKGTPQPKPVNTPPGTITTFADGHSITNTPLLKPFNIPKGAIGVLPDGTRVTNELDHVLSPGAQLLRGTNVIATNPKAPTPTTQTVTTGMQWITDPSDKSGLRKIQVPFSRTNTTSRINAQENGAKTPVQAAQSGGGTDGKNRAYPQPNAAQIKLLTEHPELEGVFEQKFGPGAAAKYLRQPAKDAIGSKDKPQPVSSQDEYDALPKGAFYVDSSGNVGQKK